MDNENLGGEKAILEERRKKLDQLRDKGSAYGNSFKPENSSKNLHEKYGKFSKEDLAKKDIKNISIAGRIVLKRVMGKASFATLRDSSGDIQIYVTKNNVDDDVYEDFKTWDLGDIVGVSGTLFRTQKDELTIDAWDIEMITKSLRPMPEKFKGLTDIEARYRQRYLDLMTNSATKDVFIKRTKIIDSMRKKMNKVGYLEVETPMMHPLAGGAVARPFVTQHNALGQDLYLRIAPELYLKRLLVGGFEKVFEINRSFRNEGLSTKHNPEFTMMEWYQAYATMQDQMDLTRDIILNAAEAAECPSKLKWDDVEINLNNFSQSSLSNLVLEHNDDLSEDDLTDSDKLKAFLKSKNIRIEDSWGEGRMLLEVFEETVESKLIDPTFVTEYPVEVSPLSRRNEEKPEFADRFELFIGGKEFANGFCELNDPDDQASRFEDQVAAKNSGDKEAMDYDHDYITALEHGMPPAVGVGMGVDRLVMLLTNQSSIRDVLLFPQLKS
ncbi:MAG: lysine--tRNA ligase [Gammaproteobacteria bacterium]|nr:lysine--tRNA ligase [Gammaproteobacteria bacterium]|tara:strand:+ start:165 stop:1655 length:1491 start_codon:yes stop_codon:yes gene_type:complete